MQTVDSIERDYVSALTNIFENITQDEYFRPVPLGEKYTLTEEKKLVLKPLILVERRAVSYRNTLRCLDPKTITEAGTKDLSLRRIENIFKVEANRLTNQDLLAGVDLEISQNFMALEPYRKWAIQGVQRGIVIRQESAQDAPMVGEKVEDSQRAIPTVSIVQRYKDGGEKNKEIAARYSDFFGYEVDSWPTVYGRMKAFMKGKYKGNRR